MKAAPPRLVALAGNPNVGKTLIFNRLTGADLRVGNYPGVTVELTTNVIGLPDGARARLVDVPGAYSLSARSEDERIALQAIIGQEPMPAPELVVVVVDATQLGRNLYLALQVIETGAPVLLCVNMIDELDARSENVDREALERELGVPVVLTSAAKRRGMDELKQKMAELLEHPERGRPGWRWRPSGDALQQDVASVRAALPDTWTAGDGNGRADSLALWALLSIDDDDEIQDVPPTVRDAVNERRRLAEVGGRSIEEEVIEGRYRWIDERLGSFLHRSAPASRRTFTERLDNLLLHPALGFLAFVVLMAVIFQSLFAWADPFIGLIEDGFGWLSGLVVSVVPAGLVQDFLVEGLIGGVGNVLVFLPQILLLFLALGLLEDSGYLSRVAFLMDRLMKALGLNGRAFIPMLSGFACAIPAVMATRTMERKRDRMLTMMVVPLMTCAARLPVYTLIIAALFPPDDFLGLPVQGLMMVFMYLFSTVVALLCAAVLGRTLFKGPRVPLLMELPPYRAPRIGSVVRMMIQRSSLFVREAGKVILVCTILLWLLLSFPREPELPVDFDAQRAAVEASAEPAEAQEAQLAAIDQAEESARLRASYGGRLGHFIEPTIEPLGFDWKIGIGLIGAFAAREVFVSTMGVVYGIGEDVDEESAPLRDKIRDERRPDGKPVYTPLVGLSLMVFIALACQCMSTLAVVRRETMTWRWPLFLFVYMTGLAWIASLLVYQGGRLLGFE